MKSIFTTNSVTSPYSPVLMLAPMEGITGHAFRSALTEFGGVDMVATEFIRITSERQRIKPFPSYRCPLQVQIMGTTSQTLRGVVRYLKGREVLFDDTWLDLNVGCPSKKVTASGAGAALLCEPHKLKELIFSLRAEHSGPLSIKTRVGFQSAEQFPDIIAMLKECPLDFITIHARTRADGYHNPVNYEHLAYAVEQLPYPVIGNGEVWKADDAVRMLEESGVHGIMCGRGATRDPFLFCEIKHRLSDGAFPLPYRDEAEKRNLLFNFAIDLCERYQETALKEKRQTFVGTYKEFSVWFSRNPLIGKEFFNRIKRLQTLEDIEAAIAEYQQPAANELLVASS